MSLRVIAGIAKGRRLKPVPGDSTRPIMDRVKEALFSIIGREILDATFLDVFAGTGSVAIEALSRGAKRAVLIDLDKRAIQTINDNLAVTGFTDRAIVRRADGLAMLESKPDAAYDFIYIAPPQFKGMWKLALDRIDANIGWAAPRASIIVQIDPSEREEPAWAHLHLFDERKYGSTVLLFFQPQTPEPPTTDVSQPPGDN